MLLRSRHSRRLRFAGRDSFVWGSECSQKLCLQVTVLQFFVAVVVRLRWELYIVWVPGSRASSEWCRVSWDVTYLSFPHFHKYKSPSCGQRNEVRPFKFSQCAIHRVGRGLLPPWPLFAMLPVGPAAFFLKRQDANIVHVISIVSSSFHFCSFRSVRSIADVNAFRSNRNQGLKS
jgi:hypothetical protein